MKTIRNITIFVISAVLLILTGCIKNDIPFARIQANLLEIEAEGQTAGAVIDSVNRTVNFYFPEITNIREVHIASYKLAEGVIDVGDSLAKPIDMSTPATITLRLYQDYQWTLIANQTVERYFSIANQIGTSTIDVPAHRVVAYVSENADITKIEVRKKTKLTWPRRACITILAFADGWGKAKELRVRHSAKITLQK